MSHSSILGRSVVTLSLLAVTALAVPGQADKQTRREPMRKVRVFELAAADADRSIRKFLLRRQVASDKDGKVRLAHSLMLADEMGATDYRQTETLHGSVQVKKVFVLDSAEASTADLFFFGSAKEVTVNGKAMPTSERLLSTGWSRLQLPGGLLKAGANELVLKGGQLLLEPGRQPGHSYKSSDGGRSWSNEALGARNNQQGEYLIRLRLGRYAPCGWAMSQVFDLWTEPPASVATPGTLVAIHSLPELTKKQPAGTTLTAQVRTGGTPTPDASWTSWMSLASKYQPEPAASRHRWAQLKFELQTTQPQATPQLPERLQLAFDSVEDELPRDPELKVLKHDSSAGAVVGSTPFVYQEPSPRLKLLRERYKLDEVIAPGKTEMEQLMLLRYWVRNQWHTAWGNHPAQWMPPWDALIILESKDQPDCLTMCTHYAAVFTQCCLALGWNARHCILDHHCVAEVYVGQHDKWVMMDAGNSSQRADVGLHFERDGVPMSARELHLAQRARKSADIQVCFTPARLTDKIAPLCRPTPPPKTKLAPRPDVIPLAELSKFPVCQLENYRRYAFPARNNLLTSLVPGELYQGWSEYFYDGYCWVGDSPDAPRISPEYSMHLDPERPQDVDWKLNWTRIHLCRTAKPGELQVQLETHTPNLDRFEVRLEDGGAQRKLELTPGSSSFTWRLQPGDNVLAVSSVNHWGKWGSIASARARGSAPAAPK